MTRMSHKPRRRRMATKPVCQRKGDSFIARVEALAEMGLKPADIATSLSAPIERVRDHLEKLGRSPKTGGELPVRGPAADHAGHLKDLRAAYPDGAMEIVLRETARPRNPPLHLHPALIHSPASSPAGAVADLGSLLIRDWR